MWLQTLTEVQSPQSKAQSPELGVEGAGESRAISHPPVTIHSLQALLAFPQMAGPQRVAQRISPKAAMENLRIMEQLQRWLGTNAQEALALEVGLLKLQL